MEEGSLGIVKVGKREVSEDGRWRNGGQVRGVICTTENGISRPARWDPNVDKRTG